MQLNLNGNWQFRESGKGEWLSAEVPGCNYLDLLRAEKIPDPFVGLNEKDVYWVGKTDWEYQKTFDVSDALCNCDRVFLDCKTLDTICDVYLNDICVGHGENAHCRYEFDVKSALVAGKNHVRIVFYSPVNYVTEKQAVEKCPRNNNGQDGIPHIRKPQCHFGWDWGPVLPPSGISGDISIQGYSTARIAELSVLQHHRDAQVELEVQGEVTRFSEKATEFVLTVTAPDGRVLSEEKAALPENGIFTKTVVIENPELWWTRDLSDKPKQPLYRVSLSIASDGETLDVAEKKIGLRTIRLNRERDEYGENFQFVLNGVPLFIKGANWIPPDSFVNRFSEEKLQYTLNAVKFSNMNMLRIWGGGYYESDALYALCDQDGILIWQDFCFACQPYPFFDESLLENVHNEVIYNVKRLRHHACLAVWSGNNEIETMSIAWRNRLKYMQWTEKFFYNILPQWMQGLDTVTPYIPGSPCGTDYMKGYDRDNVGDTHLWAVWHGLQPLTYYRKRLTRFCSEFGFESLPDLKTIEQYAKPEDYALTSDVFSAHQKCNSGNMKMAYYITSRFRLPKDFTDYIYLSQICQEECVRDATEHWRRNKGRCNGSMYWQLNDCWPVCSWASLDYFGNYKALQYAARHFNAPITISVEDSKERLQVVALNDTTKPVTCMTSWRLLDFDGAQLAAEQKELTLEAVQNQTAFDLTPQQLAKKANLKRCVFVAELHVDGVQIARRTILFAPEKNLSLPKTEVEMQVSVDNGVATYTLASKHYQRFVQVHSASNMQPFSDNYFDLLPGETKTITQKVPDTMTKEEICNTTSLFSAGDIVPRGSRLSDFLTKAGVFLRPINFGSYMYDHKIPGDYNF